MSGDSSDFWTADVTGEFNFVKHNEIDYEGFRDFKKNMDERYSDIEAKRAKADRIASLEKWDRDLPPRWKDAKFSLIKKPVVGKIIAALETHPRGSFFLRGESGAGKTFVAYALVRRLIGHGVVKYGQIKMISETALFGIAGRGFKGADAFEELLSKKYHLYIFDGIGSLTPAESEKVAPLWEQLIDHIFSRDLVAIFTSSDELDRFVEVLSPSAETKIRTLIGDRDFVVEPEGSIARKGKGDS